MDGDSRWEQAWRAFDVDLQADHDSQPLTGVTVDSLTVFNDIADEFDIEPASEATATIDDTDDVFAHAWGLLGVWLADQEEPSALETAGQYNHILDTLGLKDDEWSALRNTARANAA